MSWCLNLHFPKALPCFSFSPPYESNHRFLSISCTRKETQKHSKAYASVNSNPKSHILGLAAQISGVLATIAEPAFAVTGESEIDLVWVLIQCGITGFLYFIVFPPIIMTWLNTRWYKRNLVEMYFQFMFVFLFFPGVLLWAPFLNLRKFPRDPSMKYPWSTPEDPSKIKGGFRKYPWAQPEDYD